MPVLRTARVLRVEEHRCEVSLDGAVASARYAPQFPSPHVDRVSPGHLVAVATGPDGAAVVIWRWYDAVVLEQDGAGSMLLWEPAHGEVRATARPPFSAVAPGTRAWASAGLPGAPWWVAGPVADTGAAELDEVASLYGAHGLWDTALAPEP